MRRLSIKIAALLVGLLSGAHAASPLEEALASGEEVGLPMTDCVSDDNFRDQKLVLWDRSGDTKTSVDPSDPDFQSHGAEVLKLSLELAAPVYEKIGAD